MKPQQQGITFKDRLCVLGGADLEQLRKMPRVSGQFVQMALVLLCTAGLAGVSMWFALVNGVHVPPIAALPVALFWAFLILNLDRFLTQSMSGVHSPGKLALIALPRILMAALIGFVVSTPLVLRVFESDINAAVASHNLQASGASAVLLAQSAEQKEVDRLKALIQGYENTLEGEMDTSSAKPGAAASRIAELDKKIEEQQKVVDQAVALEECERSYGRDVYVKRFPGRLKDPEKCSPRSGTDGRWPEIKADLDRQTRLLKELISERTAAVARQKKRDEANSASAAQALAAAQADARKKIEPARDQLAQAEERLANVTQNQGDKISSDTGLLAQIRGLRILSEENSDMRLAHWAVAALFFMIELLPVVVKTLTNLGKPSVYEQALEMDQDSWLDEARVRRNDQRHQIEADAAKRKAIEDDMRSREKDLAIKANARVAAEMETILEDALADWSSSVQNGLAHKQSARGQRPATAPPAAATSRVRATFNTPNGAKL